MPEHDRPVLVSLPTRSQALHLGECFCWHQDLTTGLDNCHAGKITER